MNTTKAQIASLSNSLGFEINNFLEYHDGFSFTVDTELEAYKAAYKYQGLRTTVKYAPNINKWSVHVYKKG